MPPLASSDMTSPSPLPFSDADLLGSSYRALDVAEDADRVAPIAFCVIPARAMTSTPGR